MWHYVAVKIKDKAGHYYYCVKEFYPKYGTTVDECYPMGETKKELIRELEMMLEDVKYYKTKTEEK